VDRLAIYCIVQKRNKSNNDASRKINDSRRYLMYLPQLVPSGSRVIRKLKTFSESPHCPYMGVSASLDSELCRKVSMRGLVEEGAPTDFGQRFFDFEIRSVPASLNPYQFHRQELGYLYQL